MIDCVFVIMIASLLGAFTLALMVVAWTLFEETEIGQILIEKITSWFGRNDDDETD